MPTETQSDARGGFVPRFLPWLLAAAMLALYCFTLNYSVSLLNSAAVSKISGWTWQPEVLNPVTFLVTYPFRWLPAVAVPSALDIFSALCAALTLGLLARTVAVMPHDRTDAQRVRETSDSSILTTRSAWLPPLLAALVCGLQLTFWERATNFTGEMFDLLLFAFAVWSLAEYRLDEHEWRLFLAAFVFAAGMANDWGMVAFFPLFLVAIVWLRGFGIFSVRFLSRMALCGLAGMLFYLLLPALTVIAGGTPFTFWELLKLNLSPQYGVVKIFMDAVAHPGSNTVLLSLLLAYLTPVLLMAIRWKSSFGDRSKIGSSLASLVFHLIHGVFLLVCLWLVFDPPFSPRQRGFGLMFYYLIALCAGYYSGYFLLIFGKQIANAGRRARREPASLQWWNRAVVAGVWVLGIAAAAGLMYRNAPQIRAANDGTLMRYGSLVASELPRAGGYLMSDDAQRLTLVQSALAREGRLRDFVPLETHSLVVPAYHRFLHRKFPLKWPELVSPTQTNLLNPVGLMAMVAKLSLTNDFYYLHPSFGYYFEAFYLEPHGLAYKMKMMPEGMMLPPPPDKNLIAENENFWSQSGARELAAVQSAVSPPNSFEPQNPGAWLLKTLHAPRDQDLNAVLAGAYYSRDLDFWGVQLQRAGELDQAAVCFENARKFNPDNLVAQKNLDFNKKLRAGETVPVDLSQTGADQFGRFATLNDVLNADGPFDEPSFCYKNGLILAEDNGFFRQALADFTRVRKFDPDYLPARLWVGRIYVMFHQPRPALDALSEPLANPEKFSLDATNETPLDLLAAAAYFQETNLVRGSQLLEKEINRQPDNGTLLAVAAQAYMAHGMFSDALKVVDRRLRLGPDDPGPLFNRGYICIQLKDYDGAITALNRVLAIQSTNNDALYNRAIANLDAGRLDAAHADYSKLQQLFTNSFRVAYGLAEIAWRQHDTNEAVRNLKIYLANAPTNSAEAQTAAERLRQLNVTNDR
jgi:tetratricopeptide (TPR) repeat protein